ncbi:DNA repair protein RecO [Patescibacteria group bacterium]|nr:DNA repair protein RecO [Patescibacteria group bacterium]
MRSFKTEGIVIKRKNFREADRILTIYSKEKGKITVKAKGVRKITSRRSPHIELLNRAKFGLYQAAGANMPVLTEVESLENFKILKNDLKRIGIAYHFCELVDGLCAENQENREIYDLLDKALKTISVNKNLDLVAYRFELKLLKLLGFYHDNEYLPMDQTQGFIESILERKLKAKQIMPRLS